MLWEACRDHYGKSSDVLVWKAASREINPCLDAKFVKRKYEEDPARAASEYGAEFRSDLESFISREAVEARVQPGLREQAPLSAFRYQAFVDSSGGSRDSFTLAIAHRTGEGTLALDAVREPPGDTGARDLYQGI